jgi:lipopolysaccharide/colanic/teichoic acid biosynthesis glycosyltransferase
MVFINTSLLIVALDFRARHGKCISSHIMRMRSAAKRVIERILAVALLILFAPVLLLIVLAVRWDSPGPAVFRQTRIGKNGNPFTLYKFRTMHPGIDSRSHQVFWKAFVNGQNGGGEDGNDVFKPAQRHQLTRLGRFLRRTSLDELPQLINIIKGDMSFIGPRPNVVAEVEAYQDWHRKRLAVLPGITGLAQVNGRSRLTFDQIVRYDIEYIEHKSLMLDLKILWHTLPVVLFCIGAK